MFEKTINELILNGENIASKRIKYLINKIDLNSIKFIMDIGSWHLKQTIEMSIIFPNAVIHAFEPNPKTYELCLKVRDSLPESLKNRIFVHKIAFSDSTGQADFYVLDESKTDSLNEGIASLNLLSEKMDGALLNDKWIQKKISVDTDTIDNWCFNNKIVPIDLIWMDVQGAELKVLNGANTVIKSVKAVCTEVGVVPYYENHSLKNDVDEYFFKNSFCELKEAFLKTSWSSDIAAEADVIYVNKKFAK